MKITTAWYHYGDSVSLVEAVDENTSDGNPDWLANVIVTAKKNAADREIVDYAVADIEVPDAWVWSLFSRSSTEAIIR